MWPHPPLLRSLILTKWRQILSFWIFAQRNFSTNLKRSWRKCLFLKNSFRSVRPNCEGLVYRFLSWCQTPIDSCPEKSRHLLKSRLNRRELAAFPFYLDECRFPDKTWLHLFLFLGWCCSEKPFWCPGFLIHVSPHQTQIFVLSSFCISCPLCSAFMLLRSSFCVFFKLLTETSCYM